MLTCPFVCRHDCISRIFEKITFKYKCIKLDILFTHFKFVIYDISYALHSREVLHKSFLESEKGVTVMKKLFFLKMCLVHQALETLVDIILQGRKYIFSNISFMVQMLYEGNHRAYLMVSFLSLSKQSAHTMFLFQVAGQWSADLCRVWRELNIIDPAVV